MEFTFRHFSIQQDRCAMKVGTDGVLLGAWAAGGCRILDIGTGTGLVALMMAQRFPNAHVDAVEIDTETACQASENIARSMFRKRVSIFNIAIQNYTSEEKYDSITCNPPYFENSLKNPDLKRMVARHTDSLTYGELLSCANRLLTNKGTLNLVLPVAIKEKIILEAVKNNLSMINILLIKTTLKKEPKRCLISFGKNYEGSCSVDTVVLMDGQKRSEWYDTLTKDFYIR